MNAQEAIEMIRGDLPEGALMLRGLRAMEGLTQQQFADEMGVSRSYVAKIEAGQRTLSERFAHKIGVHYGILPQVFWYEVGEDKE